MLCGPDGAPAEIAETLLSTEYGADGVQRRATLELWPDGEDGQPLRGAGTLISSSSRQPPGAERRDRLLPLVGRGARGARPLRDRARRWLSGPDRGRRSPTSGGPDDAAAATPSWPFRTRPGSRPKASAGRCRRPPRRTARTRSSRLERGEISEATFLEQLTDSLEPLLGHRPQMHRFKEIYFEALDPNPPMIELMRELKASGTPDGDADQQRARVGAALALDAAGRRDLRDRRRLRLRRLPQARSADL